MRDSLREWINLLESDVLTRLMDCATKGTPLYREESPSIKRGEFTGTRRHPPPLRTRVSAPIKVDHDGNRRGWRADLSGGFEYIDCETVLRHIPRPILWKDNGFPERKASDEDAYELHACRTEISGVE